MLVRLRQDVFVRRFGPLGYVTSQLTKDDRVYDEAGAVFLAALAREPRPVERVVADVLAQFVDAPPAEVEADVREFLADLEAAGFVVTGADPGELDRRDVGFTYDSPRPKTMATPTLLQQDRTGTRPSEEVMLEWFRDHPTIFGAHLEITTRCNERCLHCYQTRGDDGRRHHDMDLSMVRDILGQLSEMGTASLTLSGGEPGLHPRLPEILRLARAHDLMVNVLSNGSHLSDEAIATLAAINVNMVQISLYGMDPAVHEEVTGVPGSHARTVQAIERLIAADVPVQVSCPIMRQNRSAYAAVSRWCREHRIRVLTDFVMMARANLDVSNLAHRLTIEETRQVIQDILDVDEEYQLVLDLEPKTKDLEAFADRPVCGVCIDNACFTADGSMYPCAGFQGYLLGNVKERSIRDIWESGERVAFLRSIRNSSFPACLRCAARDYCIMCLVRNFNEGGGDMFRVADHFCQVAFLNRELVEQNRALAARRAP